MSGNMFLYSTQDCGGLKYHNDMQFIKSISTN